VAVEVRSWELGIGRKVLLEEGRMDGERRRRKDGEEKFLKRILGKKGFWQELRTSWLVLLIFFRCVGN
jgi:hypothetical protein